MRYSEDEGNCTECQHSGRCVGPIGLVRNCPGNLDKEAIAERLQNGFHGIFERKT